MSSPHENALLRPAAPVFPLVKITLDRPRVFQFSGAAWKRFRAFHNLELAEIETTFAKDVRHGLALMADLIWCALPDADREEISREECARRLTLDALLGVVQSMKPAPNHSRN